MRKEQMSLRLENSIRYTDMKKTIITLLALAGVAMGADYRDAFTLSSKYNNTATSTSGSAFDAIINQTDADAETITGLVVDRVGYGSCSVLFNIDQMLADVQFVEGQSYLITSISFVSRNAGMSETAYTPTPVLGYRYTSNDAYTSIGATVTYDYEDGKYGTQTYTFEGGITLNYGTNSLYLQFNTTDESYGFAVAKNTDSCTIQGVAKFDDTWHPVAQISGIVVPEPTTATLSLLALAGLAARRRRK